MWRYVYDENICNGWKSYPLRLIINRVSKCCRKWLVLVQSMGGGYVTANCFKCGTKEPLTFEEFDRLPFIFCCPKCKQEMEPKVVEKNYCYICQVCDLYIRFADLLPNWNELK